LYETRIIRGKSLVQNVGAAHRHQRVHRQVPAGQTGRFHRSPRHGVFRRKRDGRTGDGRRGGAGGAGRHQPAARPAAGGGRAPIPAGFVLQGNRGRPQSSAQHRQVVPVPRPAAASGFASGRAERWCHGMINREVMELMNRYLDGDLDERELAELERHLQQSTEAAAMFERLKRLLRQLEQLPMVTPPTSIVDAILPRLDQIGAGSEHAAADNAPARRSGRFRPNRSFAGAAAAAVLLLAVALPSGIALLNRQSAYEMEASSAGASLNSALMMSGQEIASKTEEQNAFTAQFSLKVADQSGSPDGGAHPEMSAGGASGPPEGGVPDGRSGGSGAPETVDKSLPVMEGSQPGKAALGFTG